MKLSKRQIWILGAIALIVIILMTVFTAPINGKNNSGSTYSRDPDGYGAWYTFMTEKGTPIQRWQKPFQDLKQNTSPITLLRVNSQLKPELSALSQVEEEWVTQGNTLIILGIYTPVTEAEFSTLQESKQGQVKIETRRRKKGETGFLRDEFGAIVWKKFIGEGQMIMASTPYLGANAYQDFQGNYKFLSQLVTQQNQSIFVDEYIHGYKDTEVIKKEVGENILSYLQKTPLVILAIQSGVLLILLLWANNHRFGNPLVLAPVKINNTQAYIEALAAVLQKANRSEFVISLLTQAEKRQLQKALGLGNKSLHTQTLIEGWQQQTGQSPQDLETLLKMPTEKQPLNRLQLLNWLEKWHKIRNPLNNNKNRL